MHAKSWASNPKQFNLQLLDIPALKRIDGGHARLYETTAGRLYPSVTTVLGAMSDKSGLDEWRARVGDEEADRVGRFSSTRGTNIHSMCEDYVEGRPVDLSMPHNAMMFNQIRRVLDEHVDNVRAVECTLVSDRLRVAGTCDLIAEYDNRLSIIDYKTSARLKEKEWIQGYFLQTSLYAYMLWEMTGILCPQIVIMIACEDSVNPQVFVENPSDYFATARQMVKSYHELYK